MSIKQRILTWQAALVIAACLATSLTALHLMTVSLTASQLDKLQVIALDQAHQISSAIDAKAATMERIAMGQEMSEYARTYNDPALVQYLSKFTAEFSSLAHATEDGTVQVRLLNSIRDLRPDNISNTQVFQDALWERNKVHSVVDTDPPGDGAPASLTFGICRQSYFDVCEGVVVGRVPLSHILKDVRTKQVDKSGFVVVLDDEGRILSHPRRDLVLQSMTAQDQPSRRLLADALSLHAGGGRATLAGVDAYVAYCPVPGQRWTVVAALPHAEFMAAPIALRNAALAVSAIVLVVCLAASALIASTITRGLRTLTGLTSALADGDLSQRVTLSSRDEIGTLGKAFNHMAEHLHTTIEELNTEIHERQQAQADLGRINQQLRQTQSDLVESEKMGVLGELAAGVAHEINTPTGAILNVSVDALDHLRRLALLEPAWPEIPPQTHQWLLGVLADLRPSSPASGDAMMNTQRREVQNRLRQAGAPDPRRLAEIIVAFELVGQMDDPSLLQHLSHEPVVEFLEHVGALKTAAEIATSSARKIARIVRALGFYSRDSRGAVTTVNVNDNIEDTLAILHNRLKHLAEIHLNLQPDLPLIVGGPELAQVWTNIFANACDAVEVSKGDGLGRVEISTEALDARVRVKIANNGPPIPPQIIDRVFDPFFTTKPVGSGTGLGLSICAGIVRRYAGTITARNESGWVIFEIVFPTADSNQAPVFDDPQASAAALAPVAAGSQNAQATPP